MPNFMLDVNKTTSFSLLQDVKFSSSQQNVDNGFLFPSFFHTKMVHI